MRWFVKSASYLFHPVWMPFLGSLIYFVVTPRFFPLPLIKAKLLAIAITTMFIPIVFYFLLKNLGKAHSLFLSDVKERRWPLFFFNLLICLNLYQILDVYNFPALYYFFVGILFSSITGFLLALVKLKISLHMVGLSGILMFVLALSIFYRINLIYTISFMIVAIGLTATSRMELKAHTWLELILGFFIGLVPQIIVLNFWL
ncbi:hypothetical protein LZ575_17130 [Antarcticibacterium sp. 1MA-6-2]|uniref:hypothetical protein n=1 Tax=Antarcticibacterium sp. 1MA-6-2 TaxID=2908210 RepID=UPI001F2A26FB|nr:hypothetical protein [Antarcticibacterium sp. 1MA-6-2]UJH90510.1 hypothetical protein LZ575_17130 [Antarcticibacterium sp. 1MA-6-2]